MRLAEEISKLAKNRQLLLAAVLAVGIVTALATFASGPTAKSGKVQMSVTYKIKDKNGKATYTPLSDTAVLLDCASTKHDQYISSGKQGFATSRKIPKNTSCTAKLLVPGDFTMASGRATQNVKVSNGKLRKVSFKLQPKKVLTSAKQEGERRIAQGGSIKVTTFIDDQNGGTDRDRKASASFLLTAASGKDPNCLFYSDQNNLVFKQNSAPGYPHNVIFSATDAADGVRHIDRCANGAYQIVPEAVLPTDFYINNTRARLVFKSPAQAQSKYRRLVTLTGKPQEVVMVIKASDLYTEGSPVQPTKKPTTAPTKQPTNYPTTYPTTYPTSQPTTYPTHTPQ